MVSVDRGTEFMLIMTNPHRLCHYSSPAEEECRETAEFRDNAYETDILQWQNISKGSMVNRCPTGCIREMPTFEYSAPREKGLF